MVLVNQSVTHKVFGAGNVTSFDGNYLTVLFEIGERKFIFPDAFDGYLTANDPLLSTQIKQLLDSIVASKHRILEEKQRKQEFELQNKQIKLTTHNAKKPLKIYPRANIAFKCNFCDGGKSDQQVGFYGVCSDVVIKNNIAVEHRTWCTSDTSACLKYFNGKISRSELDAMCDDGGFVCYESQMLQNWKALAGIIQHGENRDKPMKLNRVQTNSLCVLTTRDPSSTEGERFIFAVFLVDETYQGDGQEEGYVSTNSDYKIKLSPKEARSLLFWNYHSNGNRPEVAAWSSGLHRYFDDMQAAQILRDIANLKIGTTDEDLAQRFYEHFCVINKIDCSGISGVNGALKRSKND